MFAYVGNWTYGSGLPVYFEDKTDGASRILGKRK